MKNLKITKGEWEAVKGKDSIWIESPQWSIADVNKKDTIEEAEANANLIADAGTTANKCGKLPSELLAERNELLEALQRIYEIATEPNFDIDEIDEVIAISFKAINKTLSK